MLRATLAGYDHAGVFEASPGLRRPEVFTVAGPASRGQPRRSGQMKVMGGALRSYVPLCVTEIRHWVVDEAASHDDVALLILHGSHGSGHPRG